MTSLGRPASTVNVTATSFVKGPGFTRKRDDLTTEEPLEIRVGIEQSVPVPIAITMRTPGNDFELAAGFLVSEGVAKKKEDIRQISYCKDPGIEQEFNIVNVSLSSEAKFDLKKLSRNVYTSSSCGVCGKASLELVRSISVSRPVGDFQLSPDQILSLPQILEKSQNIFSRTGGIHACGLFNNEGNLLMLREDVGRHNAMDKIVGSFLMANRLPATGTILLLSGRASFELIQKAVFAGIPAVAAVGAPSSLSVELAKEYGLTLIGFLRNERFNVYAGLDRIAKN
jgi:FdhD protein